MRDWWARWQDKPRSWWNKRAYLRMQIQNIELTVQHHWLFHLVGFGISFSILSHQTVSNIHCPFTSLKSWTLSRLNAFKDLRSFLSRTLSTWFQIFCGYYFWNYLAIGMKSTMARFFSLFAISFETGRELNSMLRVPWIYRWFFWNHTIFSLSLSLSLSLSFFLPLSMYVEELTKLLTRLLR